MSGELATVVGLSRQSTALQLIQISTQSSQVRDNRGGLQQDRLIVHIQELHQSREYLYGISVSTDVKGIASRSYYPAKDRGPEQDNSVAVIIALS